MVNDYIRREDMLNAVEQLNIISSVDGIGNPTNAEDFRVQFIGTVLKVKPVDVAPVRHAYWIRHENADIICGYYVPSFECSQCGAWKEDDSDFCPDCGAKMDGENKRK